MSVKRLKNKLVKRYIENKTDDNFETKVDLYQDGLKWGSHVCCVPEEAENNVKREISYHLIYLSKIHFSSK